MDLIIWIYMMLISPPPTHTYTHLGGSVARPNAEAICWQRGAGNTFSFHHPTASHSALCSVAGRPIHPSRV